MLNTIWLVFFILSILVGMIQCLITGDGQIVRAMVEVLFTTSRTACEIALGLIGTLAFWQGLLRVASDGGLVSSFARLLAPLFHRIMPGVPKNHPALGTMTLNMVTNILGMDNAATPIGIQAMKQLQELNPRPDTATNAQILFLVINSSSVTLLPVTIFMYRAQLGAAEPADVFLPILFATSASTLAGLLSVAWVQRLKIFDTVILAYASVAAAVLGTLFWYFATLPATLHDAHSSLLAGILLLSIIAAILLAAWKRGVKVYESFIEGAKEGFDVAVTIIPYLVAMLVAIALLRSSGVLGYIIYLLENLFMHLGFDTDFVAALPVALMRPFSGSGSRTLLIEAMQTYGADSFPGRIASIIQGSTETTFYMLAVYYGAIGVKKIRHTLGCALLADVAGIITAIVVGYWFFH